MCDRRRDMSIPVLGQNDATHAALTAVYPGEFGATSTRCPKFGRARCAGCRGLRLMDLKWHGGTTAVRHRQPASNTLGDLLRTPEFQLISPGAGSLVCRECETWHTCLFEWDASGKTKIVRVVVVEATSLSTKHTPESVAYYLSQSSLSRNAGARSAAVAMARTALEHLLFEQGFKGMLGGQITELMKRYDVGTAPPWAASLDLSLVDALRQIGNGAVHTNDGKIELQAQLDDQSLDDIEVVLEQLLEVVYERPQADAARLGRLNAKAAQFKKVK